MAAAEQGPVAEGLFSRVKNILLSPNTEWARIDLEPASVKGLFVGYACILAAIGPLASLIGGQLFGLHILLVSYHPSLLGAIARAVVSYLLSLGSVFVLGLIIDGLAPTFGGAKKQVQAMKVAVYSSTASWVAGIFGLVPALAILSLVGLYSLYLLYLGLPKLMKTPQDKALGYTALVVVAYIVIFLVVAWVTSMVAVAGMGAAGVVTPTIS